jgi:hypothetical protein
LAATPSAIYPRRKVPDQQIKAAVQSGAAKRFRKSPR